MSKIARHSSKRRSIWLKFEQIMEEFSYKYARQGATRYRSKNLSLSCLVLGFRAGQTLSSTTACTLYNYAVVPAVELSSVQGSLADDSQVGPLEVAESGISLDALQFLGNFARKLSNWSFISILIACYLSTTRCSHSLTLSLLLALTLSTPLPLLSRVLCDDASCVACAH